jgi:hypothetical protein
MRHYVTNEFNNSAIAKGIAAEKREATDGKINSAVATVLFIAVVCIFKHAIGG